MTRLPLFAMHDAPAVGHADARQRWLAAMGLTLLGYALMGRGFAYVGLPPLFIGEIMLLWGAAMFILSRCWRNVLDVKPAWWLAALMAWGLFRTLPYVGAYKLDAVRDAMVYAYGAFAFFIIAYIADDPTRLRIVLAHLRRFALIYIAAAPFFWTAGQFLEEHLPLWPWAEVRIIDVKGGDALVHLAGAFAFCVAGFARLDRFRLFLLACTVGICGAYNRGGLLAFLAALSICLLLRPRDRNNRRLVILWVFVLALLAVSAIRVQLPGKDRELSFFQLVENVTSIASQSKSGDLDGTKQWRINWWKDIVDYTVHGEYFWTGKGFGINLAVDDGVSDPDQPQLRSPHNGHLTMLARGGVPMFALWVTLQASLAWTLIASYVRSYRANHTQWSSLFMFLFAYWLAHVVNASFDVFIEGPMGGIWYWSIVGLSLASVWVYRYHPYVLISDSFTAVDSYPRSLPSPLGRGWPEGPGEGGRHERTSAQFAPQQNLNNLPSPQPSPRGRGGKTP